MMRLMLWVAVAGLPAGLMAQALKGGDGNVPVVMVHGATLTGKSWETTPDGRMGWDEYFVRKGHAVYVPDQVGRGRSGFNQAAFNNVRAGFGAGG